DEEGRLEGRPEDQGPAAARAVLALHAAGGDGGAGPGQGAERGGCALHPPQLDRPDRHDLAVAGQQRQQRHRAQLCPPLQPQRHPRGQEDQGEGRGVQLRAAGLPDPGQSRRDALRHRREEPPAGVLRLRRRHHPEGARGHPGGGAEVGGQLHLQDRERPDRLPVRGLQGHLHVRLQAGPEGLHDLPLQPGRLPGRAGEGAGPREHDLPLRARGRHRGGSQGQRGDRVRRRGAYCRQPLRRAQGRLLRQVLSGDPDEDFVMSNGNGVTAAISSAAEAVGEKASELGGAIASRASGVVDAAREAAKPVIRKVGKSAPAKAVRKAAGKARKKAAAVVKAAKKVARKAAKKVSKKPAVKKVAKKATRKAAAKKTVKKAVRKTAAKKATARKAASRKAPARKKAVARKPAARKAAAKKATARKPAARKTARK